MKRIFYLRHASTSSYPTRYSRRSGRAHASFETPFVRPQIRPQQTTEKDALNRRQYSISRQIHLAINPFKNPHPIITSASPANKNASAFNFSPSDASLNARHLRKPLPSRCRARRDRSTSHPSTSNAKPPRPDRHILLPSPPVHTPASHLQPHHPPTPARNSLQGNLSHPRYACGFASYSWHSSYPDFSDRSRRRGMEACQTSGPSVSTRGFYDKGICAPCCRE